MNFRKGLRLRQVSPAMDITPLVDVVFILLIFLLVSTTFKSQEHAFSILLPVGDQKTRVARVKRPTVFVTRLGRYILFAPDDAVTQPQAGSEELTLEELSHALNELVEKRGTRTAVSVRGDARTSYQKILDVVNECHRHGLERVYFPYKMGDRSP